MREFADALHLDIDEALSFDELVEISGLAPAVLRELVECGALEPLDTRAADWRFATRVIVVARTASRLQRDFELDAHALSVVLRFAERIDALEAQLRNLRARRR